MAFLLAGQGISTATRREPHYGLPTAEVQLQAVPEPALVLGSRATLQIGDLSTVGTLQTGGTFGGVASYTWIGGAGKWSTKVERRGYRDDAGVMLSKVLGDLAADAGELGAVLDGIADRSLGYAWVRPAGVASDLLRALVGDAWWLAGDGTTHAGPRPATSIAPADLTVEPYDPEIRRAVVALAGDELAQLLPGATLTATGLPEPLPIRQLEVHVRDRAADAVLWGERTGAELLGAIVSALTQRTRYAAPLPYQVTGTSGGRSTVEPADARAVDFPGEPFLDAVYGLPGASAVLQKGAAVLLLFPAGDPGGPKLGHYLPGVLPVSLLLDATTEIKLGAGGHYLARADKVALNLDALRQAIVDLGGTVPMMADTATTKVKGE